MRKHLNFCSVGAVSSNAFCQLSELLQTVQFIAFQQQSSCRLQTQPHLFHICATVSSCTQSLSLHFLSIYVAVANVVLVASLLKFHCMSQVKHVNKSHVADLCHTFCSCPVDECERVCTALQNPLQVGRTLNSCAQCFAGWVAAFWCWVFHVSHLFNFTNNLQTMKNFKMESKNIFVPAFIGANWRQTNEKCRWLLNSQVWSTWSWLDNCHVGSEWDNAMSICHHFHTIQQQAVIFHSWLHQHWTHCLLSG